jgi:propionyl-CoA synthetase
MGTYGCGVYQVAQFASVLSYRGVQKGDTVLIYMPMIPEAMFAMLACARIGAVHSLVFGGFASKELSTRINHAEVRQGCTFCCIYQGWVTLWKPALTFTFL